MSIIWYLDTGSLQAMIQAGQYDALPAAAAAKDIEFRTCDEVIRELGDGKPTQPAADFSDTLGD